MTIHLNMVHVTATGHVLGVVSTGSDSERALEAKEIVGESLPIRDVALDPIPLTVSHEWLSVTNADVPADLVLRPRNYALVDDEPAVLAIALPEGNVTLTRTDLTVTIPSQVAEGVKLCAIIEGRPNGERVKYEADRKPAPNNGSIKVDTALAPGEYSVLVLLPGCQPRFVKKTVA